MSLTQHASLALSIAVLTLSAALYPPAVLSHPAHSDRMALLEQRIVDAPGDPELYIKRGELHLEAGHVQDARRDFDKAAELGAATELLALHWARLHYRAGELASAREQADVFLASFPASATAYELRARILAAQDENQLAANDLRQHLELQDPPAPGNYLAAAQLLQQLDQPDQALQLLDAGMDKLGLVPSLQEQAVQLSLAQGDIEDAIVRMRSLRKPLADSAAWKLDMAELLAQAGQGEQALQLTEAALAQLAPLRSTPARTALQERGQALLKRIKTGD